MNKPERYAKLDNYDYTLFYEMEMDTIVRIRIRIARENYVDIADINSEITACDGFIYVEGNYLKQIDYGPEVCQDIEYGNMELYIYVEEI